MNSNKDTVILLFLIMLAVVGTFIVNNKQRNTYREHFVINQNTNAQAQVIQLYAEMYNRQPTSEELKRDSNKLLNGEITVEGMSQRMIDSAEYLNKIKMQSNSLTPELDKMLSDRDLLNRLSQIYLEECARAEPRAMVLPLRDIFIYLDYNEYAFRAMLRDSSYTDFEKGVMSTPDLNHPQVMDAFNGSFNKNTLVTTGHQIAKIEKEKADNGDPVGVSPSCRYDRSIDDTDTDSCLSLTQALENAQAAFDKNAAARALNNGNEIPDFDSDAARTDIRIPTHKGDMVLIPELAWSVPQYRAPVCTTLGKPLLVQPIAEEKNILRGTPLNVAKNDTRIGSIMPSFKHSEFITVKQ